MTLEEKVAISHAQGKFSSAGVPRLGIPALSMSDGPHGVRAEINWNDWGYARHTDDSVTAFPALTALAATWNPNLAALYGKALGEEARYRGKDVLLGPGVNICRTPLNGRNFEYLGEDPFLAGTMAVPYIRALQKNGVAACVKHFALNNQEKWRGSVNVNLSDRALHEIYLPAFEMAVKDGGAWSIMGAYNRIWNQHACHNSRLLNEILRSQWGFDGCVITDWGGAHDTREAALNGLDIEMGSYTNGLTSESTFGYNDYYLADPYLQLIRDGEVPMEVVDNKARNVLRLIFRTAMSPARPYGSLCSPNHYAAAKLIGDESIILLKNNGILPLPDDFRGSILVVGENATRRLTDGGGSSELKPKDYFSPLESLQNRFPGRISYVQGYESGKPHYGRADSIPSAITDSLRHEALAAARNADVVIYIGGLNKNAYQDCEATDRLSYNLSYGQDILIDSLAGVNPNLIIANISGNPYAMPWLDKTAAVLHLSYLGTMGGESLADVITGAVNPSGKLPYTIPASLNDSPAHSFDDLAYPGRETSGDTHANSNSVKDGVDPQEFYREDILVGYRWFDTKNITPLFPFGHGLSYTTFETGSPQLSATTLTAPDDSITISVPITNTGSRPGAEVIQLYIGDNLCSLPRPLKELKGFKKLALNPGETAIAEFTITPAQLQFYDPETAQWIAEPGSFTIYIGNSSANIPAVASIKYHPLN